VRSHNRADVEGLSHRTLKQLCALLERRRFLLGDRPSLVDFAFFASMFRHFALDPAPAKIMVDTAPPVFAWVGRVWNARGERDGGGSLEDFADPAWDGVFKELGQDYVHYLERNAECYARGEKRFDLKLGDACYPGMPVVRYRVACRGQLLKAWRGLDEPSQQRVRARLERFAIPQWLDGARTIDAGLDREFELPLKQHYRPARGLYGLRMYQGTPWDLPSDPTE
jgi:hypothetical protein